MHCFFAVRHYTIVTAFFIIIIIRPQMTKTFCTVPSSTPIPSSVQSVSSPTPIPSSVQSVCDQSQCRQRQTAETAAVRLIHPASTVYSCRKRRSLVGALIAGVVVTRRIMWHTGQAARTTYFQTKTSSSSTHHGNDRDLQIKPADLSSVSVLI